MSATPTVHGHCLCSAVKISANPPTRTIGACHCAKCRRWGGGPMLTIDCGTDVRFEGDEHISTYASSAWAERGFCKQCGTHLFYRLKDRNQYMMPAGVFDDIDGIVFDHQIFIDEKPDHYQFANDTQNLTGEEVFAQFA